MIPIILAIALFGIGTYYNQLIETKKEEIKKKGVNELNIFNKPIKTQTGFLKIARKYKIPIVPMENKRLGNGKFLINFHKPFYNNEVEISDKDMMIKIHKIIEKWILENPQQWLWQHNRFN